MSAINNKIKNFSACFLFFCMSCFAFSCNNKIYPTTQYQPASLKSDTLIVEKESIHLGKSPSGFTVSDTGYFVYCNGMTGREAFDAKLEFDIKVIPYTGDDSWVEEKLFEIQRCLVSDSIPASGNDCDYCTYIEATNEVVDDANFSKKVNKKDSLKITDTNTPNTLF